MNSVYISGIGSITSLGQDTDELWRGLLSGVAPVKNVPESWAEFAETSSKVYIPFDFDTDSHPCPISRVETIQNDPTSLIAILAAYEALNHAGFELTVKDRKSNRLSIGGVDEGRLGVVVGSAIGGITTTWTSSYQYQNTNLRKALAKLGKEEVDEIVERYFPYETQRLNKFYVPRGMPNSVSNMVSMKFSAKAFSETVMLACASGTAAIGKAYQQIATGQADVIITGGSEYFSLLTGVIHKGFDLAEALTKDSLDALHGPFDKNRTGFTYSEGGAGFLILESEAHLEKRGGKPLAKISGYAQNYECYSMLAMEPSGDSLRKLHKDLLKQGNCSPERVDYINAHGTGTLINDQMEADIIGEIYSSSTLVNSTKSILGHTIGASGAIECLATVKQMLMETVHPTANLREPITGITLPTKPTRKKIDLAISTSYAFGGHNAALLLKSS